MLTADTITEEQLRALRGRASASGDVTTIALCCDALGVRFDAGFKRPIEEHEDGCESVAQSHRCGCRAEIRAAARAECARILNARQEAKP